MSAKSYKFNFNRKTVVVTIIHFVIFIAAAVGILLMYVGGYFSAWFSALAAALIALMLISVPRRVTVDDKMLTILCTLEIVEIKMNEILSIRQVDNSECRWMVPLFASRGFFGYFGHYLNLENFERVYFYATEWQNLVEIVDIYDDRYYISCRQAQELIDDVERCRLRSALLSGDVE